MGTKLAKLFVGVCLLGASFSSIARADQEQTAGGWGLNCNSGNVVCSSGRNIGCQSTVENYTYRSSCTQHTGSVGWVYCAVYDRYGYLVSQFSDQCP
jgi:hypothetical protein